MKEKINAIKEYLKYFPNDSNAKNNLMLCTYADELGIKLNPESYYYPRVSNGRFEINNLIWVGNKYYLTNSRTKYTHNKTDKVIVWDAHCGRLEFVSSDHWYDIEEEWNWLKDVLISYSPLDYDEINNKYVYNVENGKRLISDYDAIDSKFKEKINKKIKAIELENKKKQFFMLQQELGEVLFS